MSPLEFIFVTLFLLAVATAIGFVFHDAAQIVRPSEPKSVQKKSPVAGLSYTSQFIYQKYMELPADVRTDDIVPGLRALDVEYPNIDSHSYSRMPVGSYGSASPLRGCRCQGVNWCILREYREIYKSIEGMANAIAKQNHSLAVSRVAYDKETIMSITERLRQETDIVNKVTNELC